MASANAAVIAQWNFNSDNTLPTDASSRDSHLSATPALSTSGGGGAAAALPGTVLRFTTQNGNHASDINGMIITVTINAGAATFNNFSVGYLLDNTGYSTLNGQWTYSINGAAFAPVSGAPLEGLITDGTQTDSLGGISLGVDQQLVLRFAFSGGDGAHGSSITFDDFTISGNVTPITPVPEPVNVALGSFALIAIGLTIGRRALKARPV